MYLDNGIPAVGKQLLQEKYRRDFACYVTANERTNGAERSLAAASKRNREVHHIHRSIRKTAKLLQQPGGAPRFGKHSFHLCSV